MKDKINIPHENHAGYSGPYLERSGVESAKLAEVLVSPAERPLDEDQKAEVRSFEADMLGWRTDTGMILEDMLKQSMVESSVAPLFFAEGLMSGEAQLDGVSMPPFASSDEVYKWVAATDLSKSQLMELSKKSTEVYKTKTAEALIQGRPIEDSTTEARSLVIDPEEFIRNMQGLVASRAMLLAWRKSAPRGMDVDDAKLAYNDVFLAKINNQLATGIPIAHHLREQAKLTGDDSMVDVVDAVVSAGLTRAMERDSSRQRLFRRLDFLRNGIGYDRSGKATAVSAEVSASVAEAPRGGMFTSEKMERMKEIMLTPDEMKQVFRDILAKANLLSGEDESTWSPGRTHRAADGLFQVIINPGKATFEVDSTSGAYKVSSEPRSLYDVVIVGGFHELEHINQAIADEVIGETIKVAQIKGKRVSGLREAGANMRQRRAEEELFGYSKPYADTYASALRVLETNGSTADAIEAFYDAKLRAMPNANKSQSAREAADRVLRLIRGGINSQPMVYAEESIIVQELRRASLEAQQRALAVTGLDLVDQAKLHKFGLLEVPSASSIEWAPYILNELAKLMNESDKS